MTEKDLILIYHEIISSKESEIFMKNLTIESQAEEIAALKHQISIMRGEV